MLPFNGAPRKLSAAEIYHIDSEEIKKNKSRTTTAPQRNADNNRMPLPDGTLKLEDAIDATSDVMCVRYNSVGCHFATGHADGTIKIHDSNTSACLYNLNGSDGALDYLPTTNVKFLPKSDTSDRQKLLLACYASGKVKIWHYPSEKCLSVITENRQTLATAVRPDGSKFATAGADPRLYLYDFETKKKIRSLEAREAQDVMDGHRTRVFAVQYHPTQHNVFISGGWDNTIQYWDERERHSFRSIFGPHICGDALDIDPTSNHIITGSWRKEKSLQIWDFNSTQNIKNVRDDPVNYSRLYCAQWLGAEHIICGGCEKNIVKLLNRNTLEVVGTLTDIPQGVYALDSNKRDTVHPQITVVAGRRIYVLRYSDKPDMTIK